MSKLYDAVAAALGRLAAEGGGKPARVEMGVLRAEVARATAIDRSMAEGEAAYRRASPDLIHAAVEHGCRVLRLRWKDNGLELGDPAMTYLIKKGK